MNSCEKKEIMSKASSHTKPNTLEEYYYRGRKVQLVCELEPEPDCGNYWKVNVDDAPVELPKYLQLRLIQRAVKDWIDRQEGAELPKEGRGILSLLSR